jgi:hypothetical protein
VEGSDIRSMSSIRPICKCRCPPLLVSLSFPAVAYVPVVASLSSIPAISFILVLVHSENLTPSTVSDI